MDCKPGVYLSTLCPIMTPALDIIERVHSLYSVPLIIISTHDGAHSENSKHWYNHAFDFREYPPTNTRVLAAIKEQLPPGFRITLESELPPHFHCEYFIPEV